MKRILIFIGFTLALCSCYSTLQVRVDALDMAKMRSTGQYNEEKWSRELTYYNNRLNSNFYPQTKRFLGDAVTKLLASDTNFDQKDLPLVRNSVDSEVNVRLNRLRALETRVRDVLQNMLSANNASIYRNVYDSVVANLALEKQNITEYLESLGEIANIPPSDRDIFKSKSDGVIASVIMKGMFGNAITDDRMASFVAKAPEEYWKKYTTSFYNDETNLAKSDQRARINRTWIKTFIGNSDVAIKMDGPGNFVIKGVRLDADQAFRTSFKVLSQSIQYFGAAVAIPMAIPKPAATATTPDTGNTIAVPALEGLYGNRQTAVTIDAKYQQLTNTFLNILDAYKTDLNSRDTARRYAAIKAIKNAYQFYKTQITIQ